VTPSGSTENDVTPESSPGPWLEDGSSSGDGVADDEIDFGGLPGIAATCDQDFFTAPLESLDLPSSLFHFSHSPMPYEVRLDLDLRLPLGLA
jgi:hypothetical protein